jgi:ribosomal protein L31E
MAETSRANALQVAQAAFEGLAPLLIEHGVTSPEAEALLRAVCVHTAARAQAIKGRRPNVSRVSIKTGVDRHAVTQLLKVPPEPDLGVSSRRDAVSRVIEGWLSDTEYTEKGVARDLEIGDPSSKRRSVWSLVERYAPGVWPRLVVDELIEMDHVVTLPNGQLRCNRTGSLSPLSARVKRQTAGPRIRDALRALFDSTRSGTSRMWRTAQSLELAERDLPLVRKMLRDRFDSMFAWMTDELNSARWRRDLSKAGNRVRVGVTGFTFEEHLSKDVRSEKIRKSSRSKT